MNEFEQRLRQVPVKPVPPHWRAEILGAAEPIAISKPSERGIYAASPWMARKTHEILDPVAVPMVKRTEVRAQERAEPVSLQARLHALLWPHPKAWAGLVTAWLIILVLNVSERDDLSARAANSAPPTPEMRAELRQQQQLLVELLGAQVISDADRPRIESPRPRTQVVRIMT